MADMTLVNYDQELKNIWNAKQKALNRFDDWARKIRQGELTFCVDRNVYRNGKLLAEEPTDDEKKWFKYRMSGPTWTWQVWDAAKANGWHK